VRDAAAPGFVRPARKPRRLGKPPDAVFPLRFSIVSGLAAGAASGSSSPCRRSGFGVGLTWHTVQPGLCHTMSVQKNVSTRTHVILPVDVVADIDKLVGKRGRSAFLTELAQREIKLRLQREVLAEIAGAWEGRRPPGTGGRSRGVGAGNPRPRLGRLRNSNRHRDGK